MGEHLDRKHAIKLLEEDPDTLKTLISQCAIRKEDAQILYMVHIEQHDQYYMEEGHSGGRGRYTVRGEYSRDGGYYGDYEDGDSYRRRDDRGRYTRDGGYSQDMGDSYGRHWVRGHYSRDDGKNDMMERIRRMMEGADPEERKAAERMIRNMGG